MACGLRNLLKYLYLADIEAERKVWVALSRVSCPCTPSKQTVACTFSGCQFRLAVYSLLNPVQNRHYKIMSITTSEKTKFYIVCCEETETTQKISKAVTDWQLPGVQTLISSQISPSLIDTVAPAEYAIFITSSEQPSSQIQVAPLSLAQAQRSTPSTATQRPVKVLSEADARHGQSPQSWLFQLPKTEVSARRRQPVSPEQSVSQALTQIEVFVRNYTVATSPVIPAPSDPVVPALLKVETPVEKTAPAKKKVVLSHYRRI